MKGDVNAGGVDAGPARRVYRSAVRQDAARRTRQAIMAGARTLFLERGYAATSLADIAVASGVARPTVFAAFGSKPAILREVLDQALAGDDQPGEVAGRDWFRPVWDAATPHQGLDEYAKVCTLIAGRAAALFETVRQAADDAPEVSDLWATLLTNRRAGAQMVVEHIQSLGSLAADLDQRQAVDILWLLNDPAHYASLVLRCGWPEPAFLTWLAATMRSALLPR